MREMLRSPPQKRRPHWERSHWSAEGRRLALIGSEGPSGSGEPSFRKRAKLRSRDRRQALVVVPFVSCSSLPLLVATRTPRRKHLTRSCTASLQASGETATRNEHKPEITEIVR
ncbi:hypothetical protein MRX96_031692 [Rhipicephalus microplus]